MNARRDNNGVSTMIAFLDSDGTTPTLLKADPTTHGLDVNDGITGSDLGRDNAGHDDNRVTTMIAVSEVDGISPVPLYINANGELLVDTN